MKNYFIAGFFAVAVGISLSARKLGRRVYVCYRKNA